MIHPRGGKEQNQEKLGLAGAQLRPGGPGQALQGGGQGSEASRCPQRCFDLITNPNHTFLSSPWLSPRVSAGSQSILLQQEEGVGAPSAARDRRGESSRGPGSR